MSTFRIPNSATIHGIRSFLSGSDFFGPADGTAVLELDSRWVHAEPIAVAMAAAWGSEHRRLGLTIEATNLHRGRYLQRMGLFDVLGVPVPPLKTTAEESGRFLALKLIRDRHDISAAIADISALLHLDKDANGLRACQYCLAELLRNVIEHSESPTGAFVCAHYYSQAASPRVSIGVADCGIGIPGHLGRAYPDLLDRPAKALLEAMKPGVTGAVKGQYGTPDNAGAGLFFTRSIAKGTGGYFLIVSGGAAFRLRRSRVSAQGDLFSDPQRERHDLYNLAHSWQGTAVALEIFPERIDDFEGYFGWIRTSLPPRTSAAERIRFT